MVLSTTPTVSIIMPVYNSGHYLREAIDSVLRQDYTDYEFIIINDGSTDESQAIIDHYAHLDTRIISVQQENIGLVATLNKAIEMAKGSYIARIDGDDPWFDDKLSRQMSLFEKDATLVLVGGSFEIIDESGYFIETIFPPTRDEDIRRTMMLRNPIGHASAVFKKDAAEKAGLYSNDFGPTEDYEFWIRLAKEGRLANIADPVYRYRINLHGISQSNSEEQATLTKSHVDRQWQYRLPRILTHRELKMQSNRYLNLPKAQWMGVGMKEQFLQDNAQIGIKLIRYKKINLGVKQLLNVALTGRTGVKAVKKRLFALDKGSFKQDT